MILVTGATGKTGGEVVKQLEAKGAKLRVLVRSAEKGKAFAARNIEVAIGDLSKPETLDAALKGVDKVYLASAADPEMVTWHSNLIAAAKRAGVKHIVRLSGMGADVNSPLGLGRWHGETQKLLEQSGIAWTHLQPHYFMQNLLGFAGTISSDGAFYAPMKDAKISMVDVRDIAAVAVSALTGAGHEGKTYVITGPTAVSFAQAAEAISTAIGKPVKYVNVAPDDARKAMLGMGMPEWITNDLLGLYAYFSSGEAAFVTDTVRTIAKSNGHDFGQFARDFAAVFKPEATVSARRQAS